MDLRSIGVPQAVLDSFVPDERGLLDWFRARITEEELGKISEADGYDFDKHLEALVEIWRTGDVGERLICHPREVLQLTSHLGASDKGYSSVVSGFASAVLLRQEDGDEFPEYLLGRLMDAFYGLEEEVYLVAAQFVTYVLQRDQGRLGAMPYWSFALVYFASRSGVRTDWVILGEWMMRVDALAEEECVEEWGRSVGSFLEIEEGLRVAPWRRAIEELEVDFSFDVEFREWLGRVGASEFKGDQSWRYKAKLGGLIGVGVLVGGGVLLASALKKVFRK